MLQEVKWYVLPSLSKEINYTLHFSSNYCYLEFHDSNNKVKKTLLQEVTQTCATEHVPLSLLLPTTDCLTLPLRYCYLKFNDGANNRKDSDMSDNSNVSKKLPGR